MRHRWLGKDERVVILEHRPAHRPVPVIDRREIAEGTMACYLEKPPGFEFARTGGGAEGKWIVRGENDGGPNHVLVQRNHQRRMPVRIE